MNLLIPLYLVVAAGTIAYLLPALLARRGAPNEPLPNQHAPDEVAAGEPALEPAAKRSGRWLERLGPGHVECAAARGGRAVRPAGGLLERPCQGGGEHRLLLRAVRAAVRAAARRASWTRELLLRCLAVAVGLAVVFAGVGFVEYYRKSLFLNPKVVAANQYDNYFRVNSVFFDPNIYGRFLALVMIGPDDGGAVGTYAGARSLLGGLVLAWLLCGLVTSFSQSSIAALLLGLAVSPRGAGT